MAQANITCGQCGARLTLRDTVCPQCNTPVEFSATERAGDIFCPSCGQSNDAVAEFCQSCGVRLKSTPAPKPKQPKPSKGVQKGRHGEGRRDYWPYVAVLAIVALVGVVLYTEWFSRPSSSSEPTEPREFPSSQTTKVSSRDVEMARQAADANPSDPSLRLRLGNVQQDAGQYRPAIDSYQKYLGVHPEDANARVDMGVCYYNLGLSDSLHAFEDFSTAVREMRNAFNRVPTHQTAAFNLGTVFLQMGEMDTSNVWFQRAVAINAQTDLGKRAQKILDQHKSAG